MTNTNKTLKEKHSLIISFMKNTVDKIDNDLKRMKTVLSRLENLDLEDEHSLDILVDVDNLIGSDTMKKYNEEDIQVVEGIFDGSFMIGPEQKKYPVHPNYSSKTKLVAGDVLKLRILPDGKFLFKLIRPVERKHMNALLSKNDEGKFIAVTDDQSIYFLNQAAVSFFAGTPGDRIYILTNGNEEYDYAAIEAIVKN